MTQALPLWAENLATFDTETTGVNTSVARIVTASIAFLDRDGHVTERYDWMIDPGVEIPEGAANVHGITTEVARASGIDAAVGISQIIARLLSVFERGLPLVVYNAPYDLTLLKVEAHRHGLSLPTEALSPIIDPLIIDKRVDRFRKGKRTLEAVTAHYEVSLDGAHDAGEDAIAAARVAQALARKFAGTLPTELNELHDAQIAWAADQAASFQEYMRRVRDPNFIADGAWPLR